MFFIKNYILRYVVCMAALCAAIQTSFAQQFTYSPNDSIVANAVFDDVSVFNIIQLHPTNDTLHFKWKKLRVNLPTTWEASICDVGHCYNSIVDSSSMDDVVAGDNGLISLHLNPHFEAGTGIVQVLFWEAAEPTKIDTLSWIITAKTMLSVKGSFSQDLITIYPNPTVDILNIQTPFENGFNFSISDIQGNIILQNHSTSQTYSVNSTMFSKGLYFLNIPYEKRNYSFAFFIN